MLLQFLAGFLLYPKFHQQFLLVAFPGCLTRSISRDYCEIPTEVILKDFFRSSSRVFSYRSLQNFSHNFISIPSHFFSIISFIEYCRLSQEIILSKLLEIPAKSSEAIIE